MIYFLHNYLPQPLLFSVGPFTVKWYGLLMIVGACFGLAIVAWLAKKYQLAPNIVWDVFLWFGVGAIIGARIYYVLYAWPFYRDDWLEIFKIWHGGLAVHGVMLGGFGALLIYCFSKKINIWLILDLAATGLCAAQIIGRWGNYFNQEIVGKPTSLPWGIPIAELNRPELFAAAEYFQPVFLYESLLNVLLLLGLLLYHRAQLKVEEKRFGNIFVAYLWGYSLIRFCLEFIRTDYTPLVFGVRWAQLLSVMVFIGCSLWLVGRYLVRKS